MSSIVVYTHRLLVKLTNQDLIRKLNDLSTSIRNFYQISRNHKIIDSFVLWVFYIQNGHIPD